MFVCFVALRWLLSIAKDCKQGTVVQKQQLSEQKHFLYKEYIVKSRLNVRMFNGVPIIWYQFKRFLLKFLSFSNPPHLLLQMTVIFYSAN